MAELINQQDPYDPTGYQLRRFGLWAHIQAAPQTRQGNRTELMAVPRDIASDYEEAIAGTVIDAALLQRVEKCVGFAFLDSRQLSGRNRRVAAGDGRSG